MILSIRLRYLTFYSFKIRWCSSPARISNKILDPNEKKNKEESKKNESDKDANNMGSS